MNPLFGDFLSNLAAELGALVIDAWARRAGEHIQGTSREQALRRCLGAGLVAFLHRAQRDAPAYTELWETADFFFRRADVVKELTRLLRGQPLDMEELRYLFSSAGYPHQDPFDFAAAMADFEAIFLLQAIDEEALRGTVEAAQLLQQTRLLTVQQGVLQEILTVLRQIALRDITAIGAEAITAQSVVSGTQIVYQLTPDSGRAFFPPHWERHYLESLIAHCDRLDLTPLAASEATAESLSIAAVFTTLYLEGVSRAANETVAEALSPRRSQERLEKKQREQEQYPITASEAIAAMPRLVILGQPGGGKSTLVNYLAAQLARQRLGDANATLLNWPVEQTPVPVRIVLRRFADWLAMERRRGTAGDVWDYLEHMLARWGCDDSFAGLRQTLIAQGGIVFFDGLDEIREAVARQAIIKGAVTDFAATEKRCQIVITSRPYAYTEKAQWRLPADLFPVVSLAPFADEQIAAFNQAWYTRVMGPRRGWDAEQCRLRADVLSQTLFALPHLHRLATSPLLLTLIAQVHGQGGTLPDNRADLYRQTVELLLARWENRIVLDARPGQALAEEDVLWLGVPTGHLRDVLAQVAYRAHKQQGERAGRRDEDGRAAEITRAELKLALVERFDSGEKAEQIMAYIQHRAGLLLAQDEHTYTFPHRTFQEYLAARHLLNQSNWSMLLRDHVRQGLDWWREVFLLSAGIATVPDIVLQLLERLLPFGPHTPEMPLTPPVANWAMLAAQALVETNFHYYVAQESEPGSFTAVYRRVQSWLKEALVAETVLTPKERAEVGHWLARLGDDRPGVGVDEQNGLKLPDIVWSAEIPAGTYTIGDDKGSSNETTRPAKINFPYRLARYPITNAQFQCFLAAEDRDDEKWWQGIPDEERQFSEPQWAYANHPRETVSWYQAIAFCRWLTQKLHDGLLPAGPLTGDPKQYTITLPHEYEWEVAARWPNEAVQQRIYPWGPDFAATKANTDKGQIGQTTAVGLYPSGKNAALDLYDLSGNVWEWCRNRYDNEQGDMDPKLVAMDRDWRVLRGGSFDLTAGYARAASRYFAPDDRSSYIGFRVVVVRPPSHHPGH